MRTLLVTLLALLPATALAVDLTCTVPASAVTRAVELCEDLRVELLGNSANWSNDACATEMLRIGLGERNRRKARHDANDVRASSVAQAVSDYNTDHPVAVTRATCGDGVVDVIGGYIEQCDPPGANCDASCQVIP